MKHRLEGLASTLPDFFFTLVGVTFTTKSSLNQCRPKVAHSSCSLTTLTLILPLVRPNFHAPTNRAPTRKPRASPVSMLDGYTMSVYSASRPWASSAEIVPPQPFKPGTHMLIGSCKLFTETWHISSTCNRALSHPTNPPVAVESEMNHDSSSITGGRGCAV